MANYTISTFNFTEELLDSIFAGNMITGGTMTITPDDGYVVSASNFSHGTLTDAVASVSFSDTTTAGQLGNLVTITFTFGPLFQISSSIPTIDIPVTGSAELFRRDGTTVKVDIEILDNTAKNLNGASTHAGGTVAGFTTVPSTTGSNNEITKYSITGVASSGVPTKILTLSISADSNNFLDNAPFLDYLTFPQDVITLLFKSVTRDSDNNATIFNMDVIFNSNNDTSNITHKSFLKYNGVSIPTATTNIANVLFGKSDVSNSGENRKIEILGDPGAEFDLTVTKNSNNTSILSTGNANSTIAANTGVLASINKKLTSSGNKNGFSSFSFTQKFPAGTDEYTINLYPASGTTLGSNIPNIKPHYTITQFSNPIITLDTDAGTNYTVTTKPTIRHTGRANSFTSRLKNVESVVSFFSFSYVYTKGASGTSFSTADLPTWDSSDLTATTTTSDWLESVSNHGNEIEIFNIKLSKNDNTTPTIITVTGDVLIKKFGTASVTLNLDSSRFLTVS